MEKEKADFLKQFEKYDEDTQQELLSKMTASLQKSSLTFATAFSQVTQDHCGELFETIVAHSFYENMSKNQFPLEDALSKVTPLVIKARFDKIIMLDGRTIKWEQQKLQWNDFMNQKIQLFLPRSKSKAAPGPDLLIWLATNVLVIVGLKTSLAAFVQNKDITDNYESTNFQNLWNNQNTTGEFGQMKTRFIQLLAKIENLSIVRLQICLPRKDFPNAKTKKFILGFGVEEKKFTFDDREYNYREYDADVDQSNLSELRLFSPKVLKLVLDRLVGQKVV